MSEIQGINPAFCMNKIFMEEDHKMSVQQQQRLSPVIKEVVRKKVIKWLDAGVVYPILDRNELVLFSAFQNSEG